MTLKLFVECIVMAKQNLVIFIDWSATSAWRKRFMIDKSTSKVCFVTNSSDGFTNLEFLLFFFQLLKLREKNVEKISVSGENINEFVIDM